MKLHNLLFSQFLIGDHSPWYARGGLHPGYETFSDLIFPLNQIYLVDNLNHPVEANISDGQFLPRELSS